MTIYPGWRAVHVDRQLGIGGFDLTERAFAANTTSNVVRSAENGPLGQRMYAESRLELSWQTTDSVADVEALTVRVIDVWARADC
ncbi:MAG TPA: hypothetical protein QF572_09835 [Vicinamibacterales bacterium]|nr:hypothetical protein [Vicinamibacterales bacterium]